MTSRGFLAAMLSVFLVVGTARAQTAEGQGTAEEGDLVVIDSVPFKLSGIDAPDPGQTCVTGRGVQYDCFEMSRLALKRLLDSGPARCEALAGGGSPTQRRATCTVNGHDVAAYMVGTGWAMAYRRIAPDYIPYEAQAMSRRRGLWSGRAEAPWLWRDRQRQGN